MKTLYESIISNSGIGKNKLFADSIEYQYHEIVRLLKKLFDIKTTDENNKFYCEIKKSDFSKNTRLFETELRKFKYYDTINMKSESNSVILKLCPPVTKQFLFPEVYIFFERKLDVYDDRFCVTITISDNREYNMDFKKFY